MSNITSYFTGTGIINGQAYIDNNNDGIKDSTITSTNAASTITSAVNNLFNDQLRMISVSLYTCNSLLPMSESEGIKLATSKLSSSGMYSFANLVSGDYYISATLPAENEGDGVVYKFSSVWIGNSSKASSISIARDTSNNGSEKNENVFNNRNRKRRLGTGGVVNTASDISTINPSTGRTNCFTLKDGERVMSYNFGLYPSTSAVEDEEEVSPKDAMYFNGFENDDFTSDPLWRTSSWYNDSDLVWTVSQEYPSSGKYALKSPILDTNEMRISKSSNVTLNLPDYYPYNDNETDSGQGGTLYFSVLASVQMPFDIFEYYVDNIKRGQLGQTTASNTYQQEVVKLSPGSHEIKFVYHFNPDEVPANFFPNGSLFDDVRFGLVTIDDLYFVPDWDYTDIPIIQQPTASPIQSKMPTSTDTSVQPTISSSSPTTVAPASIQGTSSTPSSMPSVQSTSSAALVGTNMNNIETTLMNDEDTSTDSSKTNIVIGLSCALIAIVLMMVAGLYIGMKRRRRKNGGENEIGQEEELVSGDLERGSVNSRRRSDDVSTSSHCLSVEEALARKDSYPINSTFRPTTPTSNNSGQVTYYSSGTSKSFPQSQLVQQPMQQALSPVSSYTADRYDEENLNKLEQEVASLSTDIQSVPRDSKAYQVLNLHLERAKEELDAVQQDIEMPSEELDIEEDTTSSTPVPYTEAIVPHAAFAAGVEEEPDVDETDLVEDETSRGPSTRSKSPSTAEREHEVWIHCTKREDNSVADSYITFEEQWAMENTKPDPEGITKYVTNPLDAITEYVDDDKGITSEDENSCQRVKEETRSIKSKLSLKQLTRFF